MTGCYTMALCAGAAGGAHAAHRAHARRIDRRGIGDLGRSGAGCRIVVAAAGAEDKAQARRSGFRVVGLWRDRIAWQVTMFMGLQSALAYCVFGWLVPILRERGMDGVTAGAIVSFSVMNVWKPWKAMLGHSLLQKIYVMQTQYPEQWLELPPVRRLGELLII